MAQANRRGDVEGAFGAVVPAGPPERVWRLRLDELFEQQVDLHRITRQRDMPATLQRHQLPTGHLGELHSAGVRSDGVVVAVDHKYRTVYALRQLAHPLLVASCQINRPP